MYNDIYDIPGQLGFKSRGPRRPEAQSSQQQNGNVPSSNLQQEGRNQESPYANIPPNLNGQPNGPAVVQGNGTQPREESPYANIPENFQRATPPMRPPRRDLGETEPRAPRQDHGGRRDTVAIPRGEEKAPTVQMTGTFVSHFGQGYNTENHGLIFKPTGNDVLYHFSPSQANQMRASNEALIKESMQNGSQTKVSLTKDDRDRTMWKVEPADQQQGPKKLR